MIQKAVKVIEIFLTEATVSFIKLFSLVINCFYVKISPAIFVFEVEN